MEKRVFTKSMQFEKIILNIIHNHGCVSRTTIYRITDIRPSTISAITKNLIEEGVILEAGSAPGSDADTAKKDLLINKEYRNIIGLDIDFNQISAVLTDFAGNILRKLSLPVAPAFTKDEILSCITQLLDELVALSADTPIMGVGIVTTGMVDHKNHKVLLSSQLPHWRNVRLKEILEARYRLPMFVEDRVIACLYAEKWFGQLGPCNAAVYVEMGAVFGASIMIDHKILTNPNGTMGELGHFSVSTGNELCSCGNKGCLQTVVNSNIILNRMKEALRNGVMTSLLLEPGRPPDELTLEEVLRAADSGDRTAISVLSDAAAYAGKAISYIVNLLGPELIIFGGVLTEGNAFFVNAVTEELKRYSLSLSLDDLRFRKSVFSGNSGAMGAVSIVLDDYFKPHPLFQPVYE